jgi:hypothetical protein
VGKALLPPSSGSKIETAGFCVSPMNIYRTIRCYIAEEAYFLQNLKFHMEWQLEIGDKYEHKGKGIKPLY